MRSQLMVGAGRAEIQIPDDFYPYRSFKGRLFTGFHDAIHARCILLKNDTDTAVLLSLELGDLGDIELWQERVSGLTGAPKDHILLTVTHDHEAPHVSDSYHQAVVDVEKTVQFGAWSWQAVQKAVAQAQASLQPGQMSYGAGRCDININRDFKHNGRYIIGSNPHGISDKTVSVLKFQDLAGRDLAYFINYPVHGCVMFGVDNKDGGMFVSGDLPGATSRSVEERSGDVVALWTSGAAADQNPRYLAKRIAFDSQGMKTVDAGEAGYLLLQVQAESLADEVLYVVERMTDAEAMVDIKSIQKIYEVPGQEKVHGPVSQVPPDYQYLDGPRVQLHMSLLGLNDLALVGIPGEIVCSIGLQLKDALMSKYENVIVVTHCNGSISYMSDDRGFANRTFEALVSHVKRGCAQQAVVDGAMELAEVLEPLAKER